MEEIASDAGVLVDPLDITDIKNKLTAVYNDKQMRQELIEKGFKRAAQFSWKRTGEETIDVYKQLLVTGT